MNSRNRKDKKNDKNRNKKNCPSLRGVADPEAISGSKTTEELLNELPYKVHRYVTEKCKCGKDLNRRYDYELRLILHPHEKGYRYRLYYYSYEAENSENKFIGDFSEAGYKSIEDAVKSLKTYLESEGKNE